MLLELNIENFAIIKKSALTFRAGLTVFTGQTGAGKSILLDALSLCLGARADTAQIRVGSDKAVISSVFSVEKKSFVVELLGEHGIELENNELFIRRVLVKDGNSRCFLNDQPVSLSLLRRVTGPLMEVHQQFDQVLDPASHRNILDAYLNDDELLDSVAESYSQWRAAKVALSQYNDELQGLEKERAFLEHQVQELSDFDPQENEEDSLADQRQFLKQKAAFVGAYELVANAFDGGFKSELLSASRALSKFDDKVSVGLSEEIDNALSLITDISAKAQDHLRELTLENNSLEDVEGRLFELRQLARKYQVLPNDLHVTLAESQSKLNLFDSSSMDRGALESKVNSSRALFLEKAELLSSRRKAVAMKLSQAVMGELPPLKLQHARFEVSVGEIEEPSWGAFGLDKIEFVVDMNGQGELLPLQKVASGGEMARLMLALKVSLARSGLMPGLVFDEVDSGVGGDVAHAVGHRLKRLAEHVQVLVITHSPQVASAGDVHWCIEKTHLESGVETQSRELTKNERSHELARMLAGDLITPEAVAAANALLAQYK